MRGDLKLVGMTKHILSVMQLLHLCGFFHVPTCWVELLRPSVYRIREHTRVHLMRLLGADRRRRDYAVLACKLRLLRLPQSAVDVSPSSCRCHRCGPD